PTTSCDTTPHPVAHCVAHPVTLPPLNAQFMAGHGINLPQHAQAVSAMVRVASRLGLQRRQKDVGPSLADILAETEEESAAAEAAEAARRRAAREEQL